MPSIKLQSSDGDIFEVDVEVASCCETLRNMFEVLPPAENEIVPLPKVDSKILKMVIEWSTYHKNDSPVSEDDEDGDKDVHDLCYWDLEFLNVDPKTLFELVNAANYLHIKGLLSVASKAVANVIHNNTVEKLMERYQHPNLQEVASDGEDV